MRVKSLLPSRRAEVDRCQKRFRVLPVIGAAHRWLCLSGRVYDFLLVFYSVLGSRSSCYKSQQNYNDKSEHQVLR